MSLTRKEFLVQLTVGGVALSASTLLGSILESCSLPSQPSNGTSLPTATGTVSNNTVTVDISPGTPLANNGIGIVQYSGGSILVDKTSDGTYHAMTSVCTHQGCTINQYDTGTKQFVCPCHGSQFNSTGGVVKGPASASLKQYAVAVNGNQLVITLS